MMQEEQIRQAADALWGYMLKKHLKPYLSDSVCYYRAVVTTAPSGSVIGVTRPFDQEIFIPYITSAADLVAGDQCIVFVFGDTSNAVVMGDGTLSNLGGGGGGSYVLPEATVSTLGGVKIGGNINVNSGVISVNDASTSAKGVVQMDGAPTSGSSNAVTSGGVYTALADKADRVQGIWYGGCDTSASTATKVVVLNDPTGFPGLVDGVCIRVMFFYSNTTLAGRDLEIQIANTSGAAATAQPVKFPGFTTRIPTWISGTIIDFVWDSMEYDGWVAVSYPQRATTTYYGVTKLNNTVTSTTTAEAATANAVKQAYDEATSALAVADDAYALAQAAAPAASPALTGTPTAPTAASGTNTTQIATTAFVQAAITAAIGTAIGGSY